MKGNSGKEIVGGLEGMKSGAKQEMKKTLRLSNHETRIPNG